MRIFSLILNENIAINLEYKCPYSALVRILQTKLSWSQHLKIFNKRMLPLTSTLMQILLVSFFVNSTYLSVWAIWACWHYCYRMVAIDTGHRHSTNAHWGLIMLTPKTGNSFCQLICISVDSVMSVVEKRILSISVSHQSILPMLR